MNEKTKNWKNSPWTVNVITTHKLERIRLRSFWRLTDDFRVQRMEWGLELGGLNLLAMKKYFPLSIPHCLDQHNAWKVFWFSKYTKAALFFINKLRWTIFRVIWLVSGFGNLKRVDTTRLGMSWILVNIFEALNFYRTSWIRPNIIIGELKFNFEFSIGRNFDIIVNSEAELSRHLSD